MFAKLIQALFGIATDGQRKAGQGFYFGAILAVCLFGCVASVALVADPKTIASLTEIAIATLTAIKVLFGLLIAGFGMEYAGKAAEAIKGCKEPAK